jgi:hypothetical protein
MKAKSQTLGAPVARERRAGEVVDLHIAEDPQAWRQQGGSKVAVRPDGAVEASGKVASQIVQPLLVALRWAFYWQQML